MNTEIKVGQICPTFHILMWYNVFYKTLIEIRRITDNSLSIICIALQLYNNR